MGKLYPPMIESTLPAFWGNTITVPFVMNRAVGNNDFTDMQIIIKHIISGQELANVRAGLQNITSTSATFVLPGSYAVGQFYKIQLAYVQGSDVGYLSTVGIAKYVSTAFDDPNTLVVSCDQAGKCIGTYHIPTDDKLEKIYSYQFDLFDINGNLKASSGEQLHNTDLDNEAGIQNDFWTLPVICAAGDKLEYHIKTINNVQISKSTTSLPIPFTEDKLVDHDLKALLKAEMNNDLGEVKVSIAPRPVNVYKPEKGQYIAQSVSGSFVLSRRTNQDNMWQEIKRFSLTNAQLPIDLWIDRTLEAGVEYTYALQFFNKEGAYSTHILNAEGPQLADFEDAFLYDGDKQLCIKYNPKVSSFKTVKLESKVNTIGGKYPFIFRNGNTEYKEFQISGLLSALSDPEGDFYEPAAAGELRDRTGSIAPTPPTAATNLTADNFRRERNFKLNVLDWLNNGKPKLFRSPGEGNYIIQIMNTSLSPIDTLGRMLHNFNCSATEIKDYTWNNLIELGYMKLNNELSLIEGWNGTFNAPEPQQSIYYGSQKSLDYLRSTNIETNMIGTWEIDDSITNLVTASVEEIKFRPLPFYEVRYRYEQYAVPIVVDGVEKVIWKVREICDTPETGELFRPANGSKRALGIFHVYGWWPNFGAYVATSKMDAVTFRKLWASAKMTYFPDEIRPEPISEIVPIDYTCQINMQKYGPFTYNAALEAQGLKQGEMPYSTGHITEDVYALHVGNGLIINIVYRDYLYPDATLGE